MDIRPDYANLEKDGKISVVNPKDVHIDDIIVIKPGEKFPRWASNRGKSSVDTSNITGESVPRNIQAGHLVKRICKQ